MVGKTLSHYKILSELGRGGMGIVYKGEDTKLHRTVAIKVLPAAALSSDDDRARFYREARAAASLSHPNIATVFEIDEAVPEGSNTDDIRPFIAMEFIEGDTLEDRIKQGPMKLEEAVRIASEIASGLEAAHKKDIVHRDIKAANVMMDADGRAKILDFGLAQTAASTKLTRMGSTLGTVAYMSPEQARGEEVDSRTDIWALGVTLHEMIAGKHPFGGDYEQAVVYSIMNEDPEPLTAVRTGVPMGLEWIVSKCLAKKAADRYQTTTDLLVDLRNVDLSTAGMSRVSGAISGTRPIQAPTGTAIIESRPSLAHRVKAEWPLLAVASIVMFGLGYFAFSGGVSQSSPARVQKLPIHLEGITSVRFPAVSPASDYLAFSGEDTLGQSGIFLFEVETATISYVQDSEGGFLLRFSPDGKRLAFSVDFNSHVVNVPGRSPREIARSAWATAWESSVSILYYDFGKLSMMRMDLDSGDISAFIVPDTASTDRYVLTDIIPELNLGIGFRGSAQLTINLITVDLDTGVVRVGEEGIYTPRYVPGGFLVYLSGGRDGPTVVRPFDSKSREFTGPSKNLFPEFSFEAWGVGADGSLLYSPEALGSSLKRSRLFLYDLSDGSFEVVDSGPTGTGRMVRPAFSPSGQSIALHFEGDANTSMYVSEYDLETKVFSRRTFGDARRDPDWSPDGSSLYFDGYFSETPGIYRQPIDVTGEEITVVEGGGHNPTISPDGNWLAFTQPDIDGADLGDIVIRDMQSGMVSVVDSSDGEQAHPDFSPDSRYLAYYTDVTGTREVIVKPITGTAYVPIGHPQAVLPKWAPDGKSLYFMVWGDGIYRVPVTTEPIFRVLGEAERVVQVRGETLSFEFFDISPDGNTLAIAAISIGAETPSEQKNYSTLVWWQNWAQTLKDE